MLSEKQKLKEALGREASELSDLLSAEAKLKLSNWLDATERYVHTTMHGNYSDAFNGMRKELGR